eukprot:356057-Hanusia_phi.AAC.3
MASINMKRTSHTSCMVMAIVIGGEQADAGGRSHVQPFHGLHASPAPDVQEQLERSASPVDQACHGDTREAGGSVSSLLGGLLVEIGRLGGEGEDDMDRVRGETLAPSAAAC